MINNNSVCQSCCMPIDNDELCGTEKDGKKNNDYCIWCYKNGEFTQSNSTLEMMIDISAKIWAEKDPNVNVEQARIQLKNKLPQLKRWCK